MKALILCDDGQLAVVAPLCTTYGVGIEVQAFYDPDLVTRDPHAIATHRQAIGPISLRAMHGPFADLCPGSFDAMVREVARNRFELAYTIACRLGATHLVLHHGYVPGTSIPSRWLSRCTTFWTEFLDGKSAELFVHVENLLEHDPELLAELIDAVNKPNLNACLDIGHAHCHGKRPVLQWLERLGRRIGYVQLHDNHGVTDEHLGLGEGTIPLPEVCQALRAYAPEAIWALETQVPGLEPSVRWMQDHGFLTEH